MESYQKVAHLGRGSFAVVSLYRIHGALCVVKEVDLNSTDAKQRAAALREVEVLKALSHPNVIQYRDAFFSASGEHLCILMEYADGGDLAAAVQRKRAQGSHFHEREAMAVFVQLALALQYIHEQRILHRDLKSQNVFLTSIGAVKLGDFGISKMLEDSERYASTQIGTPYYLPPEMCSSKPYDFSADMWCLGILLYEMLALEVPFTASNIAALAVRICTAEPRPVPSLYSNQVRSLLATLLAKNAQERPTAAEVVGMPHVRRRIATVLASSKKAAPAEVLLTAPVPQAVKGMVTSAAAPNVAQDIAALESDVAAWQSGRCLDVSEAVPGLLVLDRGWSSPGALMAELEASETHVAEPSSVVGLHQASPMRGSLREAMESTATCEAILRELELEFGL